MQSKYQYKYNRLKLHNLEHFTKILSFTEMHREKVKHSIVHKAQLIVSYILSLCSAVALKNIIFDRRSSDGKW